MITLLVAATGIGLLSIHARWHRQVQGQLELDRCVATTAGRVRALVEGIDQDNARIREVRSALLPATLLPAARAALQATLSALVLHQEGLQVAYRVNAVAWLARAGCEPSPLLARKLPTPWSELPLIRDPPDGIGPRPMRWLESPVKLAIQLGWEKRFARAVLSSRSTSSSITESSTQDESETLASLPPSIAPGSPSHWSLHWAAPRVGPGFP